MLRVKILGPGCFKCRMLEAIAVDALEALEAEATLEHVTDFADIAKYPILFTPGLVINEKLVCGGRIPSVEEVIAWVKDAMAKEEVGNVSSDKSD